MNLDDLLFAIILAGMVLEGACFRAECLMRRRYKAAQRSRAAGLRALFR